MVAFSDEYSSLAPIFSMEELPLLSDLSRYDAIAVRQQVAVGVFDNQLIASRAGSASFHS